MKHRFLLALFGFLLIAACSSTGREPLSERVFALASDDDGCKIAAGCKATSDDAAPSAAPEAPPPEPDGLFCTNGQCFPDDGDPTGGGGPGGGCCTGPCCIACKRVTPCPFDPWPSPPVAPPGAPEEGVIVGPNGLVNAICNATNHYGSTFPSQSKVVPTSGDACSGTTVNEHGAVVTSAACAPAFWAKGQAYPGTLESNWATVSCGGTTPPAVKLKWAARINGVYPSLGVMVLCGKQMLSPDENGADFTTSSWAPPIDASEPTGAAYMHSHQPLLVTDTGCSLGSWSAGVGQHTCDTVASAGHELAAGGGLFNDVGGSNVDFLFGFHLGPGQPGRNAVRSAKSLIDAGVFSATTCAP